MQFRVSTRTSDFILGSISSIGTDVGEQRRENVFLAGHSVQLWLSFISDSPLSEPDNLKPYSLYKDFYKELCVHGLSERINYYSALSDDFVNSCDRGESTFSFDRRFLKTPVAKEYILFAKNHDPALFTYIFNFLVLLKKVEFVRPELEQTAFRGWELVEEHLSQLSIQENDIEWLKLIVTSLLPDPDRDAHFMGKHGSGAVAGNERGAIDKNLNLFIDSKLKRAISPIMMIGGRSGVFQTLLERTGRKTVRDADVYSKLEFVAKSNKAMRSICMEPTPYMLLQQNVMFHLVEKINHSLYGRFINIDDQSRNQQGAIYGSETGYVDTIDLSAASDSVHVDLVRGVFPPRWRHQLLATRTSKVKTPSGPVVNVEKFAPMGSALCFPVQSLLFTSIVIYSYLCHSLHLDIDDVGTPQEHGVNSAYVRRFVSKEISKNFWNLSAQYESIAVYGDDIICDSRTSHIVIYLLKRLGFTPNVSKSFFGSNAFRESCGVFSLNGEDVTPYRYKGKPFSDKSFSYRCMSTMVEGANTLGDLGFMRAKRYLMNFVLRWKPPKGRVLAPIAFSSDRSEAFTFYSERPRNTHLVYRERDPKDLSLLESEDCIDPFLTGEFRRWVIKPASVNLKKLSERKIRAYDAYEYHLWSRSTVLRGEDYICSPRNVVRDTKIGWDWTPIR